jgi:hypothetical protein
VSDTTTKTAEALAAEALELLERCDQAAANLAQAMNDGVNVHGAMSRVVGLREELEHIIRSLAAQPQAEPVAADGFVLVPVKLTPEIRAVFERCERDKDLTIEEAWSEMIAARPLVAQQFDADSILSGMGMTKVSEEEATDSIGRPVVRKSWSAVEPSLSAQYRREQVAKQMAPVYAAFEGMRHEDGGALEQAQQGAAEAVERERSAFEAVFPVPTYAVRWDGAGYKLANEDYIDSYRIDAFMAQWAAWKARAALASPPPVAAQPVAQGLTVEQRDAIAWARDEAENEDYFGRKLNAKRLDLLASLGEQVAALSTAHPAQADEGDSKSSADEGGV